jgi:hypothetical protein
MNEVKNYIGVFFETLNDQEFKYLQCEINKQNMKRLNHYFYLFFYRDKILHEKFTNLNKFNKDTESWILPLIDIDLENDLFHEIKEFITLPKYESILINQGKNVYLANEESFVLDFKNLTNLVV